MACVGDAEGGRRSSPDAEEVLGVATGSVATKRVSSRDLISVHITSLHLKRPSDRKAPKGAVISLSLSRETPSAARGGRA